MKITRRGVLGRFAAIAAAVAVAPAVTAEAAPWDDAVDPAEAPGTPEYAAKHGDDLGSIRPVEIHKEWLTVDGTWQAEIGTYPPLSWANVTTNVSEMRVYEAGRHHPLPWFEHSQVWAPLTFDAMAADCAAMGHLLVYRVDRGRVDHGPTPATWDAWKHVVDVDNPVDLASVDAWRRSLHES